MNKDVKEKILEQLSQLDEQTLIVAYSYAKYLVDYGCNVTQKWLTATEQMANLKGAYQKGYYEGRESLLSGLKEENKLTCDRNICLKNEYSNIGCEDCVVMKGENK